MTIEFLNVSLMHCSRKFRKAGDLIGRGMVDPASNLKKVSQSQVKANEGLADRFCHSFTYSQTWKGDYKD